MCGDFENKIPYVLLNCADGVDPAKFPKGRDSGPFTKALGHAQPLQHDIKLENLDAYIAFMRISRDLHKDYSDTDFSKRHAVLTRDHAHVLRDEAKQMGYGWDR